MITVNSSEKLTAAERDHLERKEMARGAWAEGRADDALLILDTVLSEDMTPRVAAECYVTESAFLAERNDFSGSLAALERAAPLLDSAGSRVKGSFYLQRGRVYRRLNEFDKAITDYTGAAICWEASGDKELEGASHLNLAHSYLTVGNFAMARISLDRAFALFRETGSFYLSQAYDTLANLALAEGLIELAVSAIRSALDLVDDNEAWRKTFLDTQAKIDTKLLELINVSTVEDLDRLRVVLVREALIKTGGNLSHAGKLIGLTYKGVDYIVQQYPELQRFRSERKRRFKSLLKSH